MPIPASTIAIHNAWQQAASSCLQITNICRGAITTLQSGNVSTDWVFNLLDQLNGSIANLNTMKAVAGIDAYASSQWPTYTGSFSADITTTQNAITTCINWVSSNFPKDAGGFLEGYTLNADGSRTPRQFTPAQTTGLVTQLQSVLAMIS